MKKKLILILFVIVFAISIYADGGNNPPFWYEDLTEGEFWVVDEDGNSVNTGTLPDLEVGLLNFADATELTIATGVVTITQSVHTIDGEGDADDDLVTISGGFNGDYLIIYPANSARDITLIHDTGNIMTSNSLDYTIPDNGMVILYHNGTDWLAFTGGSTFPLANDTFATWVDNAGTGEINGIKVNTSDELEIGVPLNCGNSYWGLNPGTVVTN